MTIRRSHLTLALAALAAALLYNVWYFALKPAASAGSAPGVQPPLVGAASPAQAGAVSRDPLTIPAPPPVDMTSTPSWRRDPFLFGDETRTVTRRVIQAPAPVRPTVRTILYSASRRLAIVNGRIVGIGDAVGDYTVADIERSAVVFTTPSGERVRVPVHETVPEEVAR